MTLRALDAHDRAVRATLDWVEAELLQMRGYGRATRRRPPVAADGLVAAGFADPAPFWYIMSRGLTLFAFKDMTGDRLAVMDPTIAKKIRDAPGLDLETYLAAERGRAGLGAHMKAFHERYDLPVSPTTAVAALPVGHATPDRGPDANATGWPFSLPFNLTRQPAPGRRRARIGNETHSSPKGGVG